jgi:hypothetical protein
METFESVRHLIRLEARERFHVRLMGSGSDHFFSCERDGVKEGLHRGLAKAPAALMRPVLVVQQGLRTPTGPLSAKFSIGGIRGLAWTFMSMRRLRRRMAFISVAR